MACPEIFYSVMKICHGRKLLVRIFLSLNCSEITYQKWKTNKIFSESKFNLYLTCFHEKVCVIFQQKQSFSFIKIFLIWDRCTPLCLFRGRQIMAQYKSQYWTSSIGSIFIRLIRTPLGIGVSVRECEWVSEWVGEWVSEEVSEWVRKWVSEWVSQSVRRGVSE